MNHDEFAFFNQQLAAMLRDGIPLEGGIKQLCAGMKTGKFRAELQALETDLASGTPLAQAVAQRDLPEFYGRMMALGARSNDLPGILTMLADYYHRANATWTRLKGLMVYPLLVIGVSLMLTLLIASLLSRFLESFNLSAFGMNGTQSFAVIASISVPPAMLAVMAAVCVIAISNSRLRAKLRWRLPGFREASLAQLAAALALMLKNGVPLAEALALAEGLESNSPARHTLAAWRQQVESGVGKPAQWFATSKLFPPLFLWLIQKGGEDVAAGFQKASELYQARAAYRIDVALYGALPVSILLLGQMVFWQVAPMVRSFTTMMNWLGS